MTDKSKKKTIWKNNRRNQHRKHAAHCAWSNAEQKLLHSSYIVSKRVVVLPLVPRNGESELIERDLSGVEGRAAHTGLQLRIFEAAIIAVLVRVCVCYIAALSQLGFNSAATVPPLPPPDTRTRARP